MYKNSVRYQQAASRRKDERKHSDRAAALDVAIYLLAFEEYMKDCVATADKLILLIHGKPLGSAKRARRGILGCVPSVPAPLAMIYAAKFGSLKECANFVENTAELSKRIWTDIFRSAEYLNEMASLYGDCLVNDETGDKFRYIAPSDMWLNALSNVRAVAENMSRKGRR